MAVQTTVGNILQNVKTEANLYGVTEIDPWLLDTFNEIFQEYTALDILPQFLVKDWQLNLIAGTESIGLPTGTSATGTLTTNGTIPANNSTVTIGAKTYTFVVTLTPSEGQVLIGLTYLTAAANLVSAINGTTGNGTLYSVALPNANVVASFTDPIITLTALTQGYVQNSIALSASTSPNSNYTTSGTLTGGNLALQHLKDQNIRYFPVNGQNIPLFLRKYDKYRQTQNGPPVQFIRQNYTLLLTPFANIQTGDYLLIDYYYVPTYLIITDSFPYPPLIATIKKELMARAVILTDSPAFARFKQMARESYSKSKAILQ